MHGLANQQGDKYRNAMEDALPLRSQSFDGWNANSAKGYRYGRSPRRRSLTIVHDLHHTVSAFWLITRAVIRLYNG
jgi:hypothetical protein